KPWFPVKEHNLEKARSSYHRYGRWSLLLSWAPIIGDPLTVVAGLMREPLWSFLLMVTLAKAGRYLVLAMLVLAWTE
ncbi:MAG: YqaA family protein, partial [Desulfurivibrionaceae bacterium]